MELKDIITIICDAKKEADFDPKIFTFYDPKDDLEETVANFCNSNQSVLFVPGMFITQYNDRSITPFDVRLVSLALILVKIDELSFKTIQNVVELDLKLLARFYGNIIPLKSEDFSIEEFDERGNLKDEKNVAFVGIVNEIAKKCRKENFGVDVQLLDSMMNIQQFEKNDEKLVVVGFRIDHV